MKNNKIHKQTLGFSLYLGYAALFAPGAEVQADSQRIQWNNNKHFYQRFDQAVTWAIAKNKCETQGAHLATVTSSAENGFIYSNMGVARAQDWYFLGGSDSVQEGIFAWVTGEKWVYQNFANWNSYGDTYDYVYFYFNNGGEWGSDATASDITGYFCEWSAHNYVGLATVPDLNGNGSDEIAALYVDYVTTKHTVKIRDPKTDTTLKTLTFKSGLQPPQGVVALEDINGNGVPEIGVLYSEFGQPSVGIKDALGNGAYLKTLRFLTSGYNPKEITVSPDSNGNGSTEITVLGIGKQSNAPKAQTQDSKTGTILNDTAF